VLDERRGRLAALEAAYVLASPSPRTASARAFDASTMFYFLVQVPTERGSSSFATEKMSSTSSTSADPSSCGSEGVSGLKISPSIVNDDAATVTVTNVNSQDKNIIRFLAVTLMNCPPGTVQENEDQLSQIVESLTQQLAATAAKRLTDYRLIHPWVQSVNFGVTAEGLRQVTVRVRTESLLLTWTLGNLMERLSANSTGTLEKSNKDGSLASLAEMTLLAYVGDTFLLRRLTPKLASILESLLICGKLSGGRHNVNVLSNYSVWQGLLRIAYKALVTSTSGFEILVSVLKMPVGTPQSCSLGVAPPRSERVETYHADEDQSIFRTPRSVRDAVLSSAASASRSVRDWVQSSAASASRSVRDGGQSNAASRSVRDEIDYTHDRGASRSVRDDRGASRSVWDGRASRSARDGIRDKRAKLKRAMLLAGGSQAAQRPLGRTSSLRAWQTR
jgi:hypothetical protein